MNLRLLRRISLIAVTALLSCAVAGAVAAPRGGAAGPRVKFVSAPSARTTSTVAEFRFRTGAREIACRRDNLPYRRCRLRVKYRDLSPGAHTFTLRLRHDGRTTFVRRRWTVLPRGDREPSGRIPDRPRPPGQPAAPADAPVAEPPAARPVQPPPAPPVEAPPAPGPPHATIPPSVIPDGRKLVFGDEFNGRGAVDRGTWNLYDGPGNEGYGLRRPSAFSLDGQGNMVITGEMVHGEVVSGGMGGVLDFTYGRVEFRVRTEPDPTGTMSAAVLTWPQQQWAPEFTENDMYETGPIPDNTFEFSTFIHFGTANWQKWFTHHTDPSQWHDIAMEWYPDLLEIYVDGARVFTITDPHVIPDVLHHVCIQLDARSAAPLVRPVRMFVDYIRVYQ